MKGTALKKYCKKKDEEEERRKKKEKKEEEKTHPKKDSIKIIISPTTKPQRSPISCSI